MTLIYTRIHIYTHALDAHAHHAHGGDSPRTASCKVPKTRQCKWISGIQSGTQWEAHRIGQPTHHTPITRPSHAHARHTVFDEIPPKSLKWHSYIAKTTVPGLPSGHTPSTPTTPMAVTRPIPHHAKSPRQGSASGSPEFSLGPNGKHMELASQPTIRPSHAHARQTVFDEIPPKPLKWHSYISKTTVPGLSSGHKPSTPTPTPALTPTPTPMRVTRPKLTTALYSTFLQSFKTISFKPDKWHLFHRLWFIRSPAGQRTRQARSMRGLVRAARALRGFEPTRPLPSPRELAGLSAETAKNLPSPRGKNFEIVGFASNLAGGRRGTP